MGCLPIFPSIFCSDNKSSTGLSLVSIKTAQFRNILFQQLGESLGNKGGDRNIVEVLRISIDVEEFISEAVLFKISTRLPRLEPRLSVAFS